MKLKLMLTHSLLVISYLCFAQIPNLFGVSGNFFSRCVTEFICEGDSIQLDANGKPGDMYLWNTGEITQKIWVSEPGRYFAMIRDLSWQCRYSTITTVQVNALPVISILPNQNQFICNGDSILFSSIKDPSNSLLWSSGEEKDSIWIKNTGTYFVTATDYYGCYSNSDTIRVIANYLTEDVDLSGAVGINDLIIVLAIFTQPCDCRADIDKSDKVGIMDIIRVLSVFGKSCGQF